MHYVLVAIVIATLIAIYLISSSPVNSLFTTSTTAYTPLPIFKDFVFHKRHIPKEISTLF